MQAQSAKTAVADPYRAGLFLGESFHALHPEVVFLFSTITYARSEEFLAGFHDGLEHGDTLVMGGSGDGYFETSGAGETGAAALALNSGGKVRWDLTTVHDIATDPAQRTREALIAAGASESKQPPTLAILFSDFRLDASEMEKALESVDFPVFGGLAADDYKLEESFVFANAKAETDAMVILSAFGDLSFDISIGNSLSPVGLSGIIEKADGKSLQSIDGMDAMSFVEKQTGKPVLQTDIATTSLLVIDDQDEDVRRLRSIASGVDDDQKTIDLFGGIQEGRLVQVCTAHSKDLIAEVQRIACQMKSDGFEPAAGLIVSCVGRKGLLGDRLQEEVSTLTREFGDNLPVAGFPSFGEIGPLKKKNGEYTRNLFHNMTYVLLLFGQ